MLSAIEKIYRSGIPVMQIILKFAENQKIWKSSMQKRGKQLSWAQ